MTRKIKMTLAAVAVFGASSAALAWPGFDDYPVYGYAFYDDASHTTQIGYGRTRCDGRTDYSGSYYIVWGSNSAYYEELGQVAACAYGVGLVPY